MSKLITQKQALNLMISLLTAVVLFHVLVLIQVIPYSIVWAGRINDVAEMRKFETISILINVFFLITLLLKSKSLKSNIPGRWQNIIIWFFTVLFGLNTIGNLFAESSFELYVFTPLTFIFTLLCLRIVLEKKNPKPVTTQF